MTYRDIDTVAAVESATATLRGLELAHADLVSMRERIGTEREAIAFEAMTGQGPAKKRLAALTASAASVGLELENVAAAVAEAKKRLVAARAAAERQARIDAASEATAIAAQMATQAGLVGEGIIATIARIQTYSELAQRAARLDCGSVNPRLIVVHLRRVLDNELSVIFGEGRLPPSAEVKTAAALLSGYAERLRHSAARIIGEQDEEAA